jgi:hypothetical protein
MALTLRFTPLSPTHYRFDYARADGTGEALELETESFLTRDLLRYAVESQAGLRGSFYGLLDRIGGYAELSLGAGGLGGEVQLTEMIVQPLLSALDEPKAETPAAAVNELFEDMDLRPPRWLTPAFVEAVRDRMVQLTRQWNATPPGETMTLTFDAT